MSIYLRDIPLSEAQFRLQHALESAGLWGILGIEEIPLDEQAVGRVLAEAVWARISSPNYHASAMDGFAVRTADTSGATPGRPVKLLCSLEGRAPQAAYIDTGDPMPAWADGVIPIEVVESVDREGAIDQNLRNPYAIRIRAAATPWQNVRPLGEDMVASQLVLPVGHTLRPIDLGAIATSGHDRVRVARQPRVAILPTGSELVSIGQQPHSGEITEFNSLILAGQVNGWGGRAVRFPITIDNFESIKTCVLEAAQSHDLILLNAGSSAGSEDYSAQVVETLGDLLVHGVAVRPGHPVILGMIKLAGNLPGAVPIIGIPGFPVSAALSGEIFVEPLLSRWLGRPPLAPATIKASLTRKVTSPPGDDDYLRVVVGQVGDRLLAAPLARGSGVISSLIRADGIVIIPAGSQGLPAGAEVSVRLYRQPDELRRTILAIGSHDLTLDLLAQFLAEHDRRLVSSNVGSLGGLIALRRGEAHLAGSHLLNPATGEYNRSYIRQYLPGKPVKIVALVERQQGLIVQPGNPKDIKSLVDLVKPNVIMVNRQKGAGTRVLLDYYLERLGLHPEGIRGYAHEEFTHLAVAAAIASGRADAGLGIAAAAQALGLDFIPLMKEPYELIIPQEFFASEHLRPLFDILAEPAFRQAIAALPGYDVSHMGEAVEEIS
jgi:putative molybdopterin biosynthesis protein